MSAQTANLVLLDDLEDVSRTREIAPRDLEALHDVAKWITTFVVRPHAELGRAGTVCPFVPGALERKVVWMAPEHIAGRSEPDLLRLVGDYKRLFLAADPREGDDATYKSILVVFTDLSAQEAKSHFDDILQKLAAPSYADDGLVLGAFYQGNEGTAIYNPNFRPFTPPVPFLLVRGAVVSDWKFFLNNEDWLDIWARRFRESAVHALAEELRRLHWPATARTARS